MSNAYCNSNNPYWLELTNTGNQTIDISTSFEIETKQDLISSEFTPSSISEKTITWKFEKVLPYESILVSFILSNNGYEIDDKIRNYSST